MTNLLHPATILPAHTVNSLRQSAREAEQLQQLHPEQLRIIYEANWFRLFVPTQYGGLASSLPDALQLEEALAWVDGSVGWTVTLCAGAGWFAGFLPEALCGQLFTDATVCLAGSGKASATAMITAGGYRISGQWDYATGANHATAFTANATITMESGAVLDAAGAPLVRSFVLLPGELTVTPTWKPMGMIATGSNAFAAKEVFVPQERCFIIDAAHAVFPDAIYQYPFLQFAETTLAVNSSGMALRFLELCTEQFNNYSTTSMRAALERGTRLIQHARSEYYIAAAASWEAVLQSPTIDATILHSVSEQSRRLALTARQVVDELYPACGMQAANPATELNRVWRNLHTASQHGIFNR